MNSEHVADRGAVVRSIMVVGTVPLVVFPPNLHDIWALHSRGSGRPLHLQELQVAHAVVCRSGAQIVPQLEAPLACTTGWRELVESLGTQPGQTQCLRIAPPDPELHTAFQPAVSLRRRLRAEGVQLGQLQARLHEAVGIRLHPQELPQPANRGAGLGHPSAAAAVRRLARQLHGGHQPLAQPLQRVDDAVVVQPLLFHDHPDAGVLREVRGAAEEHQVAAGIEGRRLVLERHRRLGCQRLRGKAGAHVDLDSEHDPVLVRLHAEALQARHEVPDLQQALPPQVERRAGPLADREQPGGAAE
mmetsp:Transcript_70781/g.200861  ORF Transcript_70781/g.200861 Transcript_70781/m.200861 type:complete len:302 (+) Transcript_70781:564-1469(+)